MKKIKKLFVMSMLVALCLVCMALCASAETPVDSVRVDLKTGAVFTDGNTSFPLLVKTFNNTGSTTDIGYLMKFDVSSAKSGTVEFRVNTQAKKRDIKLYAIDSAWTSATTDFTGLMNASNWAEIGSVQMSTYGGADKAPASFTLTEEIISTYSSNGMIALMVRIVPLSGATEQTTYINNEPTLTITAHKSGKTEFSFKKAEKLEPAQVVAIKEATPTVDHSSEQEFNVFDKNSSVGYVFTKFNLSNADKSGIDTAVLNFEGYADGGAGFSLYAVTTGWNSADGTYAVASEPLAKISTRSGNREFSFDVADYLKSLDNSVSSVEFRIGVTSTANPKQYSVNTGSRLNIVLDINYKAEKISDLSIISGDGEYIAERVVIEGSADNVITAIPIIALYSDDVLAGIKIGDEVTLNGEATLVSASVGTSSEINNVDKISFFLWTSLETLVPVTDSNSIE